VAKCTALRSCGASEGGVGPGTLYVTLGRMVEKGFLTSRLEEVGTGAGPPRRMYRATGYGSRVLKAWGRFAAIAMRPAWGGAQ